MPGEFDKYVPAGYQDTSTGRRIVTHTRWSELAFQTSLGITTGMASLTAAQRRAGIDGQQA